MPLHPFAPPTSPPCSTFRGSPPLRLCRSLLRARFLAALSDTYSRGQHQLVSSFRCSWRCSLECGFLLLTQTTLKFFSSDTRAALAESRGFQGEIQRPFFTLRLSKITQNSCVHKKTPVPVLKKTNQKCCQDLCIAPLKTGSWFMRHWGQCGNLRCYNSS